MNLSFETFMDVGIFWLYSIPWLALATLAVFLVTALVTVMFTD